MEIKSIHTCGPYVTEGVFEVWQAHSIRVNGSLEVGPHTKEMHASLNPVEKSSAFWVHPPSMMMSNFDALLIIFKISPMR